MSGRSCINEDLPDALVLLVENQVGSLFLRPCVPQLLLPLFEEIQHFFRIFRYNSHVC
jgi:hypothetical protein